MFEGLQRALGDALKKLRGRGRITEANIRDGLPCTANTVAPNTNMLSCIIM